MPPRLNHRHPFSFDTLSKQDVLSLLAGARALERAERCGVAQQPLRGKNLALLGTPADEAGAAAFRRAAARLGAKVACIPAEGAGTGDTVALLGRLYDAVDCEGVDGVLVDRLRRDAGVPVYDGLAAPQHAMRALAVLRAIEQRSGRPLADTRACVVHAGADASSVSALQQAAALAGLDLHVAAAPGGDGAACAVAQADVVLDLDAAASADEPWGYILQSLLLASLA